MNWEVFVPAISAILTAGGLAALLQARALNRKTSAEATKTNAEADVTLGGGWQVLVQQQHADIKELRDRMALCEKQLADAEKREDDCMARLAKLEAGNSVQAEKLVSTMVARELEKLRAP